MSQDLIGGWSGNAGTCPLPRPDNAVTKTVFPRTLMQDARQMFDEFHAYEPQRIVKEEFSRSAAAVRNLILTCAEQLSLRSYCAAPLGNAPMQTILFIEPCHIRCPKHQVIFPGSMSLRAARNPRAAPCQHGTPGQHGTQKPEHACKLFFKCAAHVFILLFWDITLEPIRGLRA